MEFKQLKTSHKFYALLAVVLILYQVAFGIHLNILPSSASLNITHSFKNLKIDDQKLIQKDMFRFHLFCNSDSAKFEIFNFSDCVFTAFCQRFAHRACGGEAS